MEYHAIFKYILEQAISKYIGTEGNQKILTSVGVYRSGFLWIWHIGGTAGNAESLMVLLWGHWRGS